MVHFSIPSGRSWKFATPLVVALLMLTSISGTAQSRRLITGKSILWPPLGVQQNVGSLPMNVVLSPNGKYALVSDMGFDQALSAINSQTGDLVSNVEYENCNYCNFQNSNGLYYGLAFGTDFRPHAQDHS